MVFFQADVFRYSCNWSIEVDDHWPFFPYLISSLRVPHSTFRKLPTNSRHHLLVNLTDHPPHFAVRHQRRSHIASLVFPHATRNLVHPIHPTQISLFWTTFKPREWKVSYMWPLTKLRDISQCSAIGVAHALSQLQPVNHLTIHHQFLASKTIHHHLWASITTRTPLFWTTFETIGWKVPMCGTTYQVDGYMVLCHKISTGIVTTLTCKSFDHSSSAPSIKDHSSSPPSINHANCLGNMWTPPNDPI